MINPGCIENYKALERVRLSASLKSQSHISFSGLVPAETVHCGGFVEVP